MKTKINGILTLLLVFMVQITFAQERTISGVVSDGMGPVADISVKVKGTTRGAVTDFDGNYAIKAKTGDTLEFTHVSYTTVTKIVGASSKINISVKESGESLTEVVVTAYSSKTIPKAKSTAAITTITAETMEDRPNASIIQTLQGQVAGLNIGTGSGQPGSRSTIILRGVGSINGNIQPLFIIDGVPVDEENFRSINSSDVASVSVLKDASASSLYGSRGANGAIIMTTKRGKFNSPLKITYKTQNGFSFLPNPNLTMMNSDQRLNFERDNGIGLGAGKSDAEIAALTKMADTNWGDIITQTGTTQSHNISLSSGSENSSSFTSIGYFNQTGTTRESELQRFNFRNNFNIKSENKKFNFSTSLTANYSKNNNIEREGTGTLANPFIVPFVGLPYLSPYNLDGSLNIVGNGSDGFDNTPFVSLNNTLLNIRQEDEVKVIGGINSNYEVYKNITAGIRFGLDYTFIEFKNISDPNSIYGKSTPFVNSVYNGSHSESTRTDVRFNNVVSLNYNNTFKEIHYIDVSAFMEYSKSHRENKGFTAFGLNDRLVGFGNSFIDGSVYENISPNPQSSDNFPYMPGVFLNNQNVGMFSYFGVAKYDYNEQYGLDVSIRRDASSRFSRTNRWGTFYSIAGRWNIQNSKFMEGSNFNALKLRASYGTSGNDRITGLYYSSLFDTYNLYAPSGGYNNTVAIVASQIAKTDLKWETSKQLNIGLDFGYNQNKLWGNVDVYKKTTTDLFQQSPISALNGTNRINSNIGDMENVGVEASLNYKVYNKNDFNFEVFANGSYNKNKVTSLPNGEDVDNGGRTVLSEGKPIGSFYAVRWAGVNPENGKNLYLTKNGDLTETFSEDDRVFIDKSIYPTYQGGFGFNSSYKGFNFNTQFSFVADLYRNNGSLGVVEDPGLIGISNSSITLLNAWKQTGDITSIPSLNTTSIRNLTTDKYIEDASFLRLRNITLGYTIKNDKLPKNFFINGMNVFIQAENLLTWSKWRGWDPESNFRTSDFFDYPTPQIITLGLEAKF